MPKAGEKRGARFVQAFKQVLSKCNPGQDFVNVLTETNNKIAQDLAGKKAKVELPCIISTLTKKLIFNDKWMQLIESNWREVPIVWPKTSI